MAGINATLQIAKSALFAQQTGIQTTGHNIANVNTDNYCRQSAAHSPRNPLETSGLALGTGVQVERLTRACDQLLEGQLANEKSKLAAQEESLKYMKVVENLFDENADSSINNLMAEFWTAWGDLANNPTGSAERVTVYEKAALLTERFDSLRSDLNNLENEVTHQIGAQVPEINSLAAQIAQLNDRIIGSEATQSANDLRDRRNGLVADLSEIINVTIFEQPNGGITLNTAQGKPLVNGADAYPLGWGNNQVVYQTSGGGEVDITDQISGGSLAGLLTVRDEIIAKSKADLDVMAREVTWLVNQQHSTGAGLSYFSNSMTGEYATNESGLLSTLPFGNRIDYTGDFKMWVQDNGSATPQYSSLEVDLGLSGATVSSWANTGDADRNYRFTVTETGEIDGANSNGTLEWTETNPATGTVVDSGTIDISAGAGTYTADGLQMTFSSGDLVAGNTFSINTDNAGNADPLALSVTENAHSILDTYQFEVTSGGTVGTDNIELDWHNSFTSGSLTLDNQGRVISPRNGLVDGLDLDFSGGTLFEGDVFTLTTDENGQATVNNPQDWHWTLSAFKDQFNRQAAGIQAEITSDQKLKISESATGQKVENFSFHNTILPSGNVPGFTAGNVSVKVDNYDALTLAQSDFQLERSGGAWSVPGAANPGYAVSINPIDDASNDNGFYVMLDGERAFTVTFEEAITNDGLIEFDIADASSGNFSYAFSDDQAKDSGLAAALGLNTFFNGQNAKSMAVNPLMDNKDHLAAGRIDGDSGVISSGDNRNALAIAGVQDSATTMAQWTFQRNAEASASSINATVGSYHRALVAALGISGQSFQREQLFAESMSQSLAQMREEFSGVSLDEEMLKLVEYQRAYQVAANLFSTADEMLQSLINSR